MKKWRISKLLKQGAFLGAAIFLAAQIYAFRELVFLGILFSITFWLVAGMACVGLSRGLDPIPRLKKFVSNPQSPRCKRCPSRE
jgi:hypothetical protein